MFLREPDSDQLVFYIFMVSISTVSMNGLKYMSIR
jgi:hypothetical protein